MTQFLSTLAVGDPTSPVDAAKSILTSVTDQLSIANIVLIIGAALGVSVGLYLLWWGSRYLVRKIKLAFDKGKLAV